jgi:hypothetical protein
MAAKGRALSIILAIFAIFASSSAFASIPRSTVLDPPAIDFRNVDLTGPIASDADASVDNAELLRHALDSAFIEPPPVQSLSETRVWVSRLERSLFVEPRPLLSDGLQKASAEVWPEIASDPTVLTPDPMGYQDSSNLYAFCGGDPVNCSDPTGEEGADIRGRQRDLARSGVTAHTAAKRRAAAAEAMAAEDELHRLATAEMIRQRRLGIDVKATDIVFYTPGGLQGVTASGQVVANPYSGAIEDQTTNLVLTATGLKVASPAIAAAFRAGGSRAAAPLAADEIAGVALGINPSAPIRLVRGGINVIESAGAYPRGESFVSATASTSRALRTSIMADSGEVAAYKEALLAGEVGLQAPLGANVPGLDFLTAVRQPRGGYEIVFTDAKSSARGVFPSPKGGLPQAWINEANQAIGRLSLDNPRVEAQIRAAFQSRRFRVRQLNVDYSATGQARVSGF